MKQNSYLKIGIIFLVIAFLFLTLFNIFCGHHRLNADSSSELVLANFLSKEGNIFSSDWYYSTELRILNYQLVTMPLFYITDSWYAVRAISNILFYIILIFSYFFLTTGLKIKKEYAVFSACLLLLPLSIDAIDIIHIGGFYIPHFIMLFLSLGLFLRSHKNHFFIFYILLCFILGISGIRYLLIIQVPLLITSFILYKKNNAKLFLKSFIGFGAYGIGFVTNHLLHKFLNFFSESNITFHNEENLVAKAGNIFNDWLKIFGFQPGATILSLQGIISVFSILFMAIVIILLFNRLKTEKKEKNSFIMIFFCSSFVLNTFVFLFENEQSYNLRYYFPVLILLVPLAAETASIDKAKRNLITACIVLAIIISSFTLYEASQKNRSEKHYNVIAFLLENNYDFGYATFWNANITTELSNGKLPVAALNTDFKTPYLWLTHKKYYDGSMNPKKSFLLLSHKEYDYIKDRFDKNQIVYSDEHYIVIPYSRQPE